MHFFANLAYNLISLNTQMTYPEENERAIITNPA